MDERPLAVAAPDRDEPRPRDRAAPDALVAIVNARPDFRRVQAERWYRVPLKSAPKELLAGQVRTLAFYLPKTFGDDAFQVRWTAPLLEVTSTTRRALLPQEPRHPRADEPYLRLALGPLAALPRPIPSRRLRRISFIPTTRARLETAAEINDLWHTSPLEDALWEALKGDGIEAERQYVVPGDAASRYLLDFALFGRERNLDVECDGDTYHLNPRSARHDNARNNFLTTRGWSVLRFTTAQVREELPEVMRQVRGALKSCGGPVRYEAAAPPPPTLWQAALWDTELAIGHSVDPRQPAPRGKRRR